MAPKIPSTSQDVDPGDEIVHTHEGLVSAICTAEISNAAVDQQSSYEVSTLYPSTLQTSIEGRMNIHTRFDLRPPALSFPIFITPAPPWIARLAAACMNRVKKILCFQNINIIVLEES